MLFKKLKNAKIQIQKHRQGAVLLEQARKYGYGYCYGYADSSTRMEWFAVGDSTRVKIR